MSQVWKCGFVVTDWWWVVAVVVWLWCSSDVVKVEDGVAAAWSQSTKFAFPSQVYPCTTPLGQYLLAPS